MKRKMWITVFAVACALTAFAQTNSEKLAEGIKYHDLSRENPEGNIEPGKEILSSLQKTMPIAKAYYGSIITIEAGVYAAKNNPIKALSLLSQGTKLIDAAIKEDPENMHLRFLRMINSYGVSEGSPLNRYKVMKTDIDWIEAKIASLDAESVASLKLHAGLYYAKMGKRELALDAFNACILASPDSKNAEQARKQKARYEE